MQSLYDNIPSSIFIEMNRENAPKLYQALKNLQPISLALYYVFEHSSDGIYLTDGEGQMLYLNKAYEKLTGFNRNELINQNARMLLDTGKVPYSVALTTIERRKPVTMDLFFELTNKLITISTNPIFNSDGSISVIIGNLTDITELLCSKEPTSRAWPSAPNGIKNNEAENILGNSSIIANDESMLRLLYYSKKVAQTNATVLISGETGTGKEELAKFIYENSFRAHAPLVQVNCGAIPEQLIESELFGYEGGAFTGAKARGKTGLFEAANGGTIFLDEIGELPYQIQAKMLRVLQEQTLTRIGSIKPVHLDVRIISATNRDLFQMVKEKTFREDLYYRLNVVPIHLPPLRERKKDILPLAFQFLSDANQQYGRQLTFSPGAMSALENYSYPGNIRELKNTVERAAILCDGQLITEQHLFEFSSHDPLAVSGDWNMDLQNMLQKLEFEYMEQYYSHFKSVRKAAEALGMDRSTFSRKHNLYKQKFDPDGGEST